MDVFAIVLAAVVGCGVAALAFKPIFGNSEEFFRCVKFWFMPDLISLFRGEYCDDWWAEAKLGFWMGGSGLAGFVTWLGFTSLFG